jgi:hypothetical protein
MNFSDITYTLPRANIFSGIEPCLAVTLASIPMMRPLLGQSNYTPDITARRTSKASNPTAGSDDHDDNGFRELDDDSSQLSLRPLEGLKHKVRVAVRNRDRRTSAEDSERNNHGQKESGGISVKQEWAVQHGARK